MPKLYVNVACEKVILDQQQAGVASLISLFSKINVNVPFDAPAVPPNAVAPKEWSIFSSWDAEEDDHGKEYFICVQLYYPDATPFGEAARNSVKFELKNKAQGIVRIAGFPIGQIGSYTVKTWLEYEGKAIGESNEFKIELEMIKISKPNA
jgi:hypothetical protein